MEATSVTTPPSISPLRRARNAVPPSIRAPLAVILNLGLTAFFSYLAAPLIQPDIDAVDRPLKELSDYYGIAAIKTVEILGYWIGGWDATQSASLSLLALAPTLYYTRTYQPTHSPIFPTLTLQTLITLFSVYIPLRFLRPSARTSSRSKYFTPERLIKSLFAASLYQLSLHVASETLLTDFLIKQGWQLETYGATKIGYAPETLNFVRTAGMAPVGWALVEVLGAGAEDENVKGREIDEEVARGLRKWWRSLSPASRRVIKRTLVVAVYQAVGAGSGASLVKGGNAMGALGLAGAWGAATGIVGPALGWVESI